MEKLPTKQIYLLLVIIVGIIALSIYSTFAIFTFDSQTKEAINISLPNTLEISSNVYEYKQIELDPNSNKIADIDLYNTFDYDLCYSVWYKIIEDDNVEIYELSKDNLTTSGVLTASENYRVRLLLINNSNKKSHVNIGVATAKEEETCELKLSNDKKNIKNYYGTEIAYLNDTVISKENTSKKEEQNNFIVEKNITTKKIVKDNIELYQNFEIDNNGFKLLNKYEDKEFNFENNKYYLRYNNEIIYEINEASYNSDGYLEITNYNKLTFYEKGTSGLKKIKDNYYYYGANPDNYISYNCTKDNCELWRVVGAFYDETKDNYNIKIVRNDYLTKEEYNNNSSNEWINSSLYNYLNKEYSITSLSKKYQTTFKYQYDTLENINADEYVINSKIASDTNEISILTMTDYLNTSTCNKNSVECLKNNWLNKKDNNNEWLLALYNEKNILENEEETIEYKVVTTGETIQAVLPTEKNYFRPVVYLKNRILVLSGNGTIENPYIIK